MAFERLALGAHHSDPILLSASQQPRGARLERFSWSEQLSNLVVDVTAVAAIGFRTLMVMQRSLCPFGEVGKEDDHRGARDLRSRHCLTVTGSAMSPCDQFIQGIDNLMAFICERLNTLSQRLFGDRDYF